MITSNCFSLGENRPRGEEEGGEKEGLQNCKATWLARPAAQPAGSRKGTGGVGVVDTLHFFYVVM